MAKEKQDLSTESERGPEMSWMADVHVLLWLVESYRTVYVYVWTVTHGVRASNLFLRRIRLILRHVVKCSAHEPLINFWISNTMR